MTWSKAPVLWWNLHLGECNPRAHWDTALLREKLWTREWFDASVLADFPADAAIVMVAGNFHHGDVDALNAALTALPGVVLIIHSDEASLFPVHEIEHPNLRLWVMTPRPDRHYDLDARWIGEGYSPGTSVIAESFPLDAPRPHDWCFVGQVTHVRRHQAVEQMLRMRRGFLFQTPGFTQGLDRHGYLRVLRESVVAVCPSGPTTQDSFRLYEALECGAIPIADDVTPDGRRGYWNFVYGNELPFPILTDYRQLRRTVQRVLDDRVAIQAKCQRWWEAEKMRIANDIERDLAAVS